MLNRTIIYYQNFQGFARRPIPRGATCTTKDPPNTVFPCKLSELAQIDCSVSRQPQFDVLSGKASRTYDDGRVQVGDELPRLRTLRQILGVFFVYAGQCLHYAFQ